MSEGAYEFYYVRCAHKEGDGYLPSFSVVLGMRHYDVAFQCRRIHIYNVLDQQECTVRNASSCLVICMSPCYDLATSSLKEEIR